MLDSSDAMLAASLITILANATFFKFLPPAPPSEAPSLAAATEARLGRKPGLGPVLDAILSPMLNLFCCSPGGAVAQLGARLDGIEEVVGSNPIGSTI